MRFGVREICNVVFKATTKRKIGVREFQKGEPVLYFDSLKTSTLEQAVTPVYAQGGRGNTRLIAWDGEKTLTFTMEDALISELGLAILAGARLYDSTDDNNKDTLIVHVTENVKATSSGVSVTKTPYTTGVTAYALKLDDAGTIVGEPIELKFTDKAGTVKAAGTDAPKIDADTYYLVDYYTTKSAKGAYQIDIEPETFGGNFYIEADTLFRDTDGADHAAQFVIPNGKIQSNFTLTMASTGDPSTFTFTVDAFPGYVNGDMSKKVLSTIQILGDEDVIGVDDPAGDIENEIVG